MTPILGTHHARVYLLTLLVLAASATAWFVNGRGGDATERNDPPRQAIQEYIARQPMSAFQAALLADKQLTLAEYDQAFSAYGVCIQEAGAWFASAPRLTSRGVYDFVVTGPGPAAVGTERYNAISLAVRECDSTYWDVVSQQRSLDTIATKEESDALADDIARCMTDMGSPPPTERARGWGEQYILPGANTSASRVFLQCARGAAERFGYPSSLILVP